MNVAVILAGGIGSRVGAKIPKQFILVLGKPILVYTIEKFQNNDNIDAIEVVCVKPYLPFIEELKEKYPDRNFYEIDTKGITICSYNIVRAVGDLYKAGKTIDEILDWAKIEVDKFAIYFFATDLKFFKRSGRVNALAAFFGNIIGIKPIINMGSDGMMKSVDKGKGLKGTLAKIMEYVDNLNEDMDKYRVIIGHSDSLEIAKMLGEMITEKYKGLDIEYVEVNPTAGSHCGPDGVGICFHAKHR